MKKNALTIFVLILALGATAGLAWAASAPNYAIDRQILAGGGQPAVSAAGDLSLNGTLGQTVAGSSASDAVVLKAGYWTKTARLHVLYLPFYSACQVVNGQGDCADDVTGE